MQIPPTPPDEAKRLEALRKLAVLDTPPDEEFDAIVRAASLVCGMPIALITLVDGDRQWFKANVGLTEIAQTGRDVSFCGHAILQEDVFEVCDALEDARFSDNPLVTGDPKIRHYAGAPLRLPDGSQVGTLCVIGREPGRLDTRQREILMQLSRAAARALDHVHDAQKLRQNALDLAQERQRLAAVIAGTGVGTWEWNLRTREFRINERWLPLLGRSEMDAETMRGLIHPEDLQRGDDAMAEHLEGRSPLFVFEGRMRNSEGGWVWIYIRGCIVTRTADGSPEWFSGLIGDHTEAMLQEEALRTSERFLAQTERFAGVGGWEIDLATGVLHWTPQAFRIAGVDPFSMPTAEEAIEFYAPEARDTVIAARERAVATGEPYDLEVPYIRADGRRIWVRSCGAAVFAGGRAVRIAGTFQDVTEQVEQRLALRTSERFLAQTERFAGVGGWEIDLDTGALQWTPQAFRIAGLDPSRPPTAEEAIAFYAPEARDKVISARERAVATGEPYDLEVPYIRADGRRIWVRSFGAAVYEGGRAVRMAGAFQDVTAQVEQRLALERMKRAVDAIGV
jgi:PAS domain S-box-containing protein